MDSRWHWVGPIRGRTLPLSIPLNGFPLLGGEQGGKTHVKKLSIPLNGFRAS